MAERKSINMEMRSGPYRSPAEKEKAPLDKAGEEQLDQVILEAEALFKSKGFARGTVPIDSDLALLWADTRFKLKDRSTDWLVATSSCERKVLAANALPALFVKLEKEQNERSGEMYKAVDGVRSLLNAHPTPVPELTAPSPTLWKRLGISFDGMSYAVLFGVGFFFLMLGMALSRMH